VPHLGTTGLREHAPMLGNRVRAVPAGQQHDVNARQRSGERPVVVEAALHNLDTFRPGEPGWSSHKGANLCAACGKGIQRCASDLARCSGDQYHGCSSTSCMRSPSEGGD
jgi:hypothetical protein